MVELNKIESITDEQWLAVKEENRKMVNEFLEQSTQLSPQTIKQYTSGLRIYFWWISAFAENKLFHEIRSIDYLKYQNFLVKNGLSSSAIRFKRSAVSSFNNYVETYYSDQFKTFRNYITKAISNPPPVFVNEKEPLTLDEYKNLCETLEKQEMWQQLAYLKFSFSTGCRRAEARQLLKEVVNYEPKIIQKEDGEIKTYFTHPIRCKGRGVSGKVRKLQFDEDAMIAIKKWLEVRGEDNCTHVFVAKSNGQYKQVGEGTFNNWANNYFEKIVGRRFHPHLIRETRATTLVVEQGKDIKAAQKLLDHQSSTTTEIYVIRKDENDADEAFT